MEVRYSETDILKELHRIKMVNNNLFMVEIDVTNACNCNCSFCFQGEKHQRIKDELSFDEIVRLLHTIKGMGGYYLSFTGGEPFCRPDFLKILSYAKKMGFYISFVSNIQLPNIEEMEQLCNIGVSNILISFHSIIPENYRAIFGTTEEAYHNALRNISFMIKKKMPLMITITLTEKNYEELDNIVEFFVEKGVKRNNIRINTLIRGSHNSRIDRGGESFYSYLKNHLELKKNGRTKVRKSDECFACSAGRTSCTIKSNGDVYPCGFLELVAGNIREKPLEDIWKSANLFNRIRRIENKDFFKCYSCEYNTVCPICISDNYNETRSFVEPSVEYCDFQKRVVDSWNMRECEA